MIKELYLLHTLRAAKWDCETYFQARKYYFKQALTGTTSCHGRSFLSAADKRQTQ
jgi:hypothetical protein